MNDSIFIFFIPAYAINVMIYIMLWMVWIRPYVKKNRRSFGHGANFGWVILSDVSIATEIAKEQKTFPWFIKASWIITILFFFIPLVMLAVM